MSATPWHQRFYDSTRGRVLTLLRTGSKTVDELAREIEVTDNAVRSHLAALERDGLVAQRGRRRGAGKPAHLYELTDQAERLFPKAYGTVLRLLLDVLSEERDPKEIERLLREAGRRLAALQDHPPGDLDARLDAAVEAIEELGGAAEVIQDETGGTMIQGYGCPLAGAVAGHPEVCRLTETLLEELTGVPVREACEKGVSPRCRFHVANGKEPHPLDRAERGS
jgi:predicted ArsR family transcriptional regulator